STLEQMLSDGRSFSVNEVVQGGIAAARALGRLHRQRVVHRDIKPANLHLADDGQWRVLDLGVAISGREPRATRELHAGTPSYMNPEQWEEGGAADAASDLYALGVTLYRWLSGRLPYGEIEPYQTGRFRRDPVPPSRLRPEVPIWLDHVVLKAVGRGAPRVRLALHGCVGMRGLGSAALLGPGARPADLHHAHHPEHHYREHREHHEAPGVAAQVLLGQAHRVRYQATAERADLADHRAGHRGGRRPARRHPLTQRAGAPTQRAEAPPRRNR